MATNETMETLMKRLDALEALIAALYFDGGLEAVNNFVSKFIYCYLIFLV